MYYSTSPFYSLTRQKVSLSFVNSTSCFLAEESKVVWIGTLVVLSSKCRVELSYYCSRLTQRDRFLFVSDLFYWQLIRKYYFRSCSVKDYQVEELAFLNVRFINPWRRRYLCKQNRWANCIGIVTFCQRHGERYLPCHFLILRKKANCCDTL